MYNLNKNIKDGRKQDLSHMNILTPELLKVLPL